MKKITCILMVSLLVAVALLSGCSSPQTAESSEPPADTSESTPADNEETQDEADSAETTAETAEKYQIALSNSFMGNDWRQQMEKIAEFVASQPPFSDKVELTIVNTENTPEAQSASIDALIQQDYDAIIIDAASPTALNPAIERAIAEGIVVVSFDSVVTAEEAYKIEVDGATAYHVQAKWLAEKIGGAGNVVLDRGLANSSFAQTNFDAAKEVFDSYPDINIVAEFTSEFAEGPAEQALASIIAANPQIDAVMTQGYMTAVFNAFEKAGKEGVPCCGGANNGNKLACLEGGYDGIVHVWLTGVGAIALQKAVEILDGEEVPNHIWVNCLFAATDTSLDLGEYGEDIQLDKIELGVNCWDDQPEGFLWPILPDDFPVQMTLEELLG